MSCELIIPPQKGIEDQKLTVGRTFHLKCMGTPPPGFDFSKARFVLSEADKYRLEFLGVGEASTASTEIIVTSYRVGKSNLTSLVLSDGERGWELGSQSWEVASVLPPENPPEPFGPMGPLRISWPWFYLVVAAALVLALFTLIGFSVFRRMQRRALLKRLQEYETALSPLQQFHSESRRWQREHAFFHGAEATQEERIAVLRDIDRQVRIFLIRKFQIPALEWNEKWILRGLKKYHPDIHEAHRVSLSSWLSEMKRLSLLENSLRSADVVQIREHSRKLLEALDRSPTEIQRAR